MEVGVFMSSAIASQYPNWLVKCDLKTFDQVSEGGLQQQATIKVREFNLFMFVNPKGMIALFCMVFFIRRNLS